MDRIYSQYRNSPKAVAWYNILPTIAAGLTAGYESIRLTYDIDTAEGTQLDIIGVIVGIGRGYETVVEVESYQFGESIAQFGNPTVQFSESTGNLSNETSDEIYRKILKAKILKNNSSAQIDDVIEAMLIITGLQCTVTDYEDMSFEIEFNGILDGISRIVLNQFDVVPRPQGVKFRGFIENPIVSGSQWFDNHLWNDPDNWID